MAEQEQESCLHTPVWGVEGFLTTTSTEVEQPTTTGKRPIRGFNILSEHSEHSTSTINFEDILAEEPLDHTDDTSIMRMIENASFDFALPEPTPSTAMHITEFKMSKEEEEVATDVWSLAAFEEQESVGLCLPAAEAEGRVELPVEPGAADLLRWIMDDNQIGDFVFPEEVTESTSTFLVEAPKEEMASTSTFTVEVVEEEVKEPRRRMKVEHLTEEEKYRRMREQNNRASQACRAKRKRKQGEQEEELGVLQERNVELRSRLEELEVEVAGYKRRILQQVTIARQ